MKPLKIAIVTQAYHPVVGGVTAHVDATARSLRSRGHEATVITSHFPGQARAPEPGVRRIGKSVAIRFNGAENHVTVGFGLKRELMAIFEAHRFDLIHVHCPLSPVLPLLALHVARQPVVGTFHSAMSSDRLFRIFRGHLLPYFRRIDRPLAVSDTARGYVARTFPGPIEVVPNGVDVERFRPGLPRLERYRDGAPTILFVGRHDPRKGLPELVRACARLAEERLPFRLVVVGDGALRRRVERMAMGALGDHVRFEGRVEHVDLPRYYASADVFCSPARGGESFGMVLVEAMAAGVPVVASDLPGYRTVLTDGAEGITVPPRNPEALAGALRRLLLDRDLRRRMGARGVQTAARFAWPGVVGRLEEIYNSLLETASPSAAAGRSKSRRPLLEPAPV
jgi:phosphatidyl-myo-inositol alpha-mannosyltransferase